MPPSTIQDAKTLAHDIAEDVGSILFTHFADADTLDTLRPGETDLATVNAINRAVATILADAGVEILVQRADRAAFRRWMQTREDTAQTRRAWIDRGKLLRGADALALLGVADAGAAAPKFAAAPGPIANRLLAAFDDEDATAFDSLGQALLDAGRLDVLDLGLRKLRERDGDEAAEALEGELWVMAEGGRLGPSGWAELVTIPVALPAQDLPDAAALGESFLASGFLKDSEDIHFLPGWRSPDAIDDLSPYALRRVLLALLKGAEPADLPPGDTDDLARQGFGVLLGLVIDWEIPIWEEIAASGLPNLSEADEEAEEARRGALFDTWRSAMFAAEPSCVPLALVPPSEVGAEIADFLEEAGERTGVIEEIRSFVAVARDEAGREDIVCRVEIIRGGLNLAAYTESGRFLDSVAFTPDRLPVSAEEMVGLIEAFVPVAKD